MVKKEIRWLKEEREGVGGEIDRHYGVALRAGIDNVHASLEWWGMWNIGKGRKGKMLAGMVT